MKGFHSRPERKGRDRRGVSEILANILVLGITVVFFAGVLAFVVSIGPDDSANVQMSASLDDDLLRIKHGGGSTLPDDDEMTRIKIVADGLTRFVPLSYGTQSPGGAQWSGPWSVGSSWYFNFSANAGLFDETSPYQPSALKVGIAYIDQSNVIWSITLRTDANIPPTIINFKVEGENSGDGRIASGDLVTFTVRVMDKDVESVVGNFTELFVAGGHEDEEFDGEAGSETWTVELTPDASDGLRTVVITATDAAGNQVSETYQLTIFTP